MSSVFNWFNRESDYETSSPKWLEEMELNDEIKGEYVVLKRIVYIEESAYSVYICEDEEGSKFKLTGTFPLELLENQTYFIRGKVGIYRKEKQVICQSARLEKPTSRHGVISFLKTLKGLNKRAENLYDIYGGEIVDILINDPLKVAKEVSGIGKKSVESWSEQLQILHEDYRILSTLLTFGISMKQAKKLLEKYQSFVVDMIEANPYFLAEEVKGFGFLKCDEIARQIGYDPKSPKRIQQGLLHVLKESMSDGHCYLPKNEILKRAKNCLDYKLNAVEMKELVNKHRGKGEFEFSFGDKAYMIHYATLLNHWEKYQWEKRIWEKEKHRYPFVTLEEDEIEEQLLLLEANMKLVVKEEKVYLVYVYQAEIKVAEKIIRMLLEGQEDFHGVEEDIGTYLTMNGLSLEEMQRKAVYEFTSKTGGMYILNGSAGCGKTFTLNVILAIMEQQYKKNKKPFRVKVFAPTGKASKVAKKATNREASTVHRGLAYNAAIGDFEYNEYNPLEADCVVLDESSMLDILLAKNLFDAIPIGCKVIFMGDTKQLPSVGAGNVLHDLINSKIIPVVTLNVVKRQAENSGIILNANKIISGDMISSCQETEDAYIIRKQSPFAVQETLVKSIERLIQAKGYSFEDIQVLCPQKNGEIGTYVMNWYIQQTFNPNPIGEKVLNRLIRKKNPTNENDVKDIPLYFQAGDKVIHVANNYSMPWYLMNDMGNLIENKDLIGITNGEIGTIHEIKKEQVLNTTQTIMVVKYEDGYVIYDSFDELDHAYAMTIHKSQGSQWPAVLIPIMMENYRMLDNSIFYTGYTRSKDFNCIIGQPEAISHAIRTFKNRDRYTSLGVHFIAEAS